MNKYIFDAANKSVGRLATEIAHVLQGKNLPGYDPKDLRPMTVSVINASKMSFKGKKLSQKTYYRHSGPLGHLKERKLKDVYSSNPAKVIEMAVRRMLPKNRLQTKRLRMLKIEL